MRRAHHSASRSRSFPFLPSFLALFFFASVALFKVREMGTRVRPHRRLAGSAALPPQAASAASLFLSRPTAVRSLTFPLVLSFILSFLLLPLAFAVDPPPLRPLLVGGDFSNVGGVRTPRGIASWRASERAAWTAVGDAPTARVTTSALLSSSDGTLYAARPASASSPDTAAAVFAWNGTVWAPVGESTLSLTADVSALFEHNGTLYAACGRGAASIVRWTGQSWEDVAQSRATFHDGPNAFATYQGALIVGSTVESGLHQLKEGPDAWVALAPVPLGRDVNALAVHSKDGLLYVGLKWSYPDSVLTWDGKHALPLASTPDFRTVLALLSAGGNVYAAGIYGQVAQWDGAVWKMLSGRHYLGSGASIAALAWYDSTVVACGSLDVLDGGSYSSDGSYPPARSIIRWTGTTWETFGNGLDPSCRGLAVHDGALVAGGTFAVAGGVQAVNVAFWGGASSAAIGDARIVNSAVLAAAIHEGEPFVGTASGKVARWVGTNLTTIAPGGGNAVRVLLSHNGTLYAGGSFIAMGGVRAQYIAQWTAARASWARVGDNSSLPFAVATLAVFQGRLCAGGATSDYYLPPTMPRVACLDADGAWAVVGAAGTGPVDHVFALLAADINDDATATSVLYAGGKFRAVGNQATSYVAVWNGTAWAPVGAPYGGLDGPVYALAMWAGDLYAGGDFGYASGTPLGLIARHNRALDRWERLAERGVSGTVRAFAVHADLLCAGGLFDTTSSGDRAVRNLACWDGQRWATTTEPGPDGRVNALLAGTCAVGWRWPNCTTCLAGYYGPTCLPCSACEAHGGTCVAGLAGRCDCAAGWIGDTCDACAPDYFGANCTACAVCARHGVCEPGLRGRCVCAEPWGGDTCEACAPSWAGPTCEECADDHYGPACLPCDTCEYRGVCSPGRAGTCACDAGWAGADCTECADVAVCGHLVQVALYAAGSFASLSGPNSTFYAPNIARWNGLNWQPIGSNGIGDKVNALAVMGPELYAGGDFFGAGGKIAASIARWDGQVWSALDGGTVTGAVEALAVFNGGLVVGGTFSVADTLTATTLANNLALWTKADGWQALGDPNGSVHALLAPVPPAGRARATCALYAGGDFSVVGGLLAYHVALWDGRRWSTLGTGLAGSVRCLASYDGAVLAGGSLDGTLYPNSVARWDGTAWSGLPMATPKSLVWRAAALQAVGRALFVVGPGATDGGVLRVFKYYRATWSRMNMTAAGLSSSRALASGWGPSDVVVGGTVFSDNMRSNNKGAVMYWDGAGWLNLAPAAVSDVNSAGTVQALFVNHSTDDTTRTLAPAPFPLPQPCPLPSHFRSPAPDHALAPPFPHPQPCPLLMSCVVACFGIMLSQLGPARPRRC